MWEQVREEGEVGGRENEKLNGMVQHIIILYK